MTDLLEDAARRRLDVLDRMSSDVLHPFYPGDWLGTQCTYCFGWVDDPRHLSHPRRARLHIPRHDGERSTPAGRRGQRRR